MFSIYTDTCTEGDEVRIERERVNFPRLCDRGFLVLWVTVSRAGQSGEHCTHMHIMPSDGLLLRVSLATQWLVNESKLNSFFNGKFKLRLFLSQVIFFKRSNMYVREKIINFIGIIHSSRFIHRCSCSATIYCMYFQWYLHNKHVNTVHYDMPHILLDLIIPFILNHPHSHINVGHLFELSNNT